MTTFKVGRDLKASTAPFQVRSRIAARLFSSRA